MAEVEAGTITAANALVKLLRLQQVTSGRRAHRGRQEAVVSTAKREALAGGAGGPAPRRSRWWPSAASGPIWTPRTRWHGALGRGSLELSGRRNQLSGVAGRAGHLSWPSRCRPAPWGCP
jgi:hypothetical protein